jgi:hypothetical protein
LNRCARSMLLMVSAGSVSALGYRSNPTSIRNISARPVNSLKPLHGAISSGSKKRLAACTAPRTRSRIRAKERYTISIDRSNLHSSMLVKLTRTLNVYRANLGAGQTRQASRTTRTKYRWDHRHLGQGYTRTIGCCWNKRVGGWKESS